MSLHNGVITGVPTLWQQGAFVDFAIEVEDQEFKVHKVILASVSDYFKTMLSGNTVESQIDRVRIEGTSPLAVANIINFIYTGQLSMQNVATEDLLACAVYFQFPSAIKKCSLSLYEKINSHNCFQIYTIFKSYALEFYVEQSKNYIKSNIDDFTYNPNDLQYEVFQILMDCWRKSEWDLFESANQWISVDFENRVQHLNDLMSHIRFALMTPEQLKAVQDSHIFSAIQGSWCDLVRQAMESYDLPNYKKVLDNPEQHSVKVAPSPVCFSADSVGKFYIGKSIYAGRSWDKHEALQPPSMGQPAAVLEVNNFLIVCDEFQRAAPDKDQNWFIFDPHTKKWDTMACMRTPRDAFAVVHHSRHLYSLGGLVRKTQAENALSCSVDDSIERFDFDSNTWSRISSKLPAPRHKHGACAIGDFIYVTAGFSQAVLRDREWHSNKLYCFHPATDTWVEKESMPYEPLVLSCTVLAMNLWDEEVMFVVSDDFQMQYYTPSTNQWAVYECNTYVRTGLKWNPEGTVRGKGNMFYFLMFDQHRPEDRKPKVQYRKRKGKKSGHRMEDMETEEEPVKDPFFLSVTWTDEDPWDVESYQEDRITEELLCMCPVKEKPFCALLSFMPESTKAE